jgi:hypothetical protein
MKSVSRREQLAKFLEGDEACLSDGLPLVTSSYARFNRTAHKQSFVVPSARLDVYTVSSCTIKFQNAQLPKRGEAISRVLRVCVTYVEHTGCDTDGN